MKKEREERGGEGYTEESKGLENRADVETRPSIDCPMLDVSTFFFSSSSPFEP